MQKKAAKKKITTIPSWNDFLLPIGIFILAFLVRFIYLIQTRASLPFFYVPIMDELYHDTLAQQIVSGAWIGTEPFYRAPLYIYVLGLTYKIFGHNLFLARLLQTLVGSVSCVLIFLIARKLFNRTVGILSGVIASFYAMLIYYDAQLLTTSLEIFLNLVLLGLLILTAEKPKPLNWFFCGIGLGLSAITRPNILIFVPFILIWMFFRFRNKLAIKKLLIHWAILCLGALLLIVPVTLRNYMVGKDFVLIAWNGGYNFYLGNNPDATGWSATTPKIDITWWGSYNDAIRIADDETKTKLRPSQISDFWFKKGLHFVISQPWSWLKLTGRKAIYFWKGYEIANNQNMYLYKNFSSLFNFLLGKFIVYFPFGLVGPLAIWGLLICLEDFRRYLLLYLFILSYSASVVIFFVCSRYRMPVIPFLIMFCSFSIWWLFQKIKAKELFWLMISSAVLMILFVGLNTKLESLVGDQTSDDHFVLAFAYKSLGKLDLAIEEYKTSLKYNPRLVYSHNNLGNIYTQQGKTEQAIDEFQKGILSDPSFEKSYYNLAILYHDKGELDSAIAYYQKAININPRYEEFHLNLGQAYYEKGQTEKAKVEWKKVLELNPGNQDAINLLRNR